MTSKPVDRLPEGEVRLRKLFELNLKLVKASQPVSHAPFIPGSTMDTERMQRDYIAKLEKEISQLEEEDEALAEEEIHDTLVKILDKTPLPQLPCGPFKDGSS